MANNPNEPPADDFLEQILGFPNFASADSGLTPPDAGLPSNSSASPMMLQLSSGDGSSGHIAGLGVGGGGVSAPFHGQHVFPLGLSLEQSKGGFLKAEEASGSGKRFREELVDGRASTVKNLRSHGKK